MTDSVVVLLRRLILGVLLVTPSLTHAAATSPPGVNLRWDQCYGDEGARYRSFACHTNTGSERMIGSFELASAPAFPISGIQVYMDVVSAGPLPNWWQLRNPGTCRQASLSATFAPPAGAANCPDWASGQAIGGIGAYNIGIRGPSTAQIIVASAVQTSALATLQAGLEYFAFALQINHAKTVGAGSCAGCDVPAVVYLSAILVVDPETACDLLLTTGANWNGSQWVSWQQGYPTNITRGCGLSGPLCNSCAFPNARFDVVPYDVTPTRNSTWGQVKALYR
jgi:hypothetical protein